MSKRNVVDMTERDELAKELKNMLHVFDRGLHSGTLGRKVCDNARNALAKYDAVTGVTQEDSDDDSHI